MENLTEIVREEVEKYAGGGRGENLILFPLRNDQQHVYAVTAIDYPVREAGAEVVVMARVAGDKVVIEEDNTDRYLVDALLQRGIPRDHIILAYDGEPIPDPERFEVAPIKS
jgi:hypothetical protein